MSFPVALRWQQSPVSGILLWGLHLLAILALSQTSLEAWILAAGAFAVLVSFAVSRSTWCQSVGELRLHADGACEFRPIQDGDFDKVEVRWHAAWPGFIALGLRSTESTAQRTLLVVPGTLDVQSERLLRLWLRQCANVGREASGQGTV